MFTLLRYWQIWQFVAFCPSFCGFAPHQHVNFTPKAVDKKRLKREFVRFFSHSEQIVAVARSASQQEGDNGMRRGCPCSRHQIDSHAIHLQNRNTPKDGSRLAAA
jgi:hypothetical protein